MILTIFKERNEDWHCHGCSLGHSGSSDLTCGQGTSCASGRMKKEKKKKKKITTATHLGNKDYCFVFSGLIGLAPHTDN